ncbi:MAG: phospho-N-acetylmuramoyl-pentapeptide-transferase [Bacteroidales bacterium]|nr:phospho-N-acetylmuramoyl-pentapeptide-transferase [Bacteroidales bacterium]MBN2761833.1 phospho-N-acetylmuramoyl-pentapeptide-transferase [Bacteroidales bacterium]
MLYYFFAYLDRFDLPGAGLFQYLSFRSGMTVITSLVISLFIGKKIIRLLQRKQIGETVRDLGLEGQLSKKGTPTMGGLIILIAILIPVLLFGDLLNVYVQLMLFITIWLGIIGFIDDYIKVFRKNKKGLRGTFKIIAQVVAGLVVGLTLHFNDAILVREKVLNRDGVPVTRILEGNDQNLPSISFVTHDVKSTKVNVPFFKNNEFDYAMLIWFMGEKAQKWAWVVVIIAVILIITFISNGANLTDGLDGLAAGTSAIIGLTLGILAYVSGNAIFSDYLNIMYLPHSGELVVFISAFIGALVGFLWYNAHPAQVFMGDTGSLAIGGIIAVYAILIRKELLIPILCGVFVVESLSVVIQVAFFKFTRYRFGEGRRIFRMAPLHHHYQKLNYSESKIVIRFWIVSILLALITIVTLKIR